MLLFFILFLATALAINAATAAAASCSSLMSRRPTIVVGILNAMNGCGGDCGGGEMLLVCLFVVCLVVCVGEEGRSGEKTGIPLRSLDLPLGFLDGVAIVVGVAFCSATQTLHESNVQSETIIFSVTFCSQINISQHTPVVCIPNAETKSEIGCSTNQKHVVIGSNGGKLKKTPHI